MNKLAFVLGLVVMMVSSAFAWQPEGWVFFHWEGDWEDHA